MRIVAPITKWTEIDKKEKKNLKKKNIYCHMSRVNNTNNLSLMQTATATDLPPANSPIMYSRLVCKDQKPKTLQNTIKLIHPFTINPQSAGKWFFRNGTNKQKDQWT